MNQLYVDNDGYARALMRSDLPVNYVLFAVTTVGRRVLALAVIIRPTVLVRDNVAVAVRIWRAPRSFVRADATQRAFHVELADVKDFSQGLSEVRREGLKNTHDQTVGGVAQRVMLVSKF